MQVLSGLLFASVLAGVLGYTIISMTKSGSTMQRASDARDLLRQGAYMLVVETANADGDDAQEPRAGTDYLPPNGATDVASSTATFPTPTAAAPANKDGWYIPKGSGAPKMDSWGTYFKYCVWDNGTTATSTGRLAGYAAASFSSKITFAVISAGPDKKMESTCVPVSVTPAEPDPRVNLVGDDLVRTVSSAQIAQGVGGTAYLGDSVANLAALDALTGTFAKGQIRSTLDGKLYINKTGDSGAGKWSQISGSGGSDVNLVIPATVTADVKPLEKVLTPSPPTSIALDTLKKSLANLEVDLPTAGTYLIGGSIRGSAASGHSVSTSLYNATDALSLANTERLVVKASSSAAEASTPYNSIIRVAKPLKIGVQAWSSVASGSSVLSDANGLTSLSAVRLLVPTVGTVASIGPTATIVSPTTLPNGVPTVVTFSVPYTGGIGELLVPSTVVFTGRTGTVDSIYGGAYLDDSPTTFTAKVTATQDSPPGAGFIISFAGQTDVTTSNTIDVFSSVQQIYATPGAYTYTVPAGVTSISIVTVGGGGAGNRSGPSNWGGGGGGGGALAYANNVPVTPGQSISIVVGNGGALGSFGTAAESGGFSRVIIGAFTMTANGGTGGTPTGGAGSGSTFTHVSVPGGVATGGGNGGTGGPGYTNGGGGGGAGGYGGRGGNGGVGVGAVGGPSDNGQATGAGGGGGASTARGTGHTGGGDGGHSGNGTLNTFTGGGGGGANIYAAGADVTTSGADGNGLGDGTSRGGNGGFPGGGAGGTYGGGSTLNAAGSKGAVRIIYGTNKIFPTNATTP